MKNTLTSLFLLLLLAHAQSCSQRPQEETENVPATARKVLDTPFHFLLGIPEYEPNRLVHDADLFSAWGYLALVRKPGSDTTREAARRKLLRAATQAGWKPTKELFEVESPDLDHYGIHQSKEDLAFVKTASLRGQNPPTRYSCRIWISDSGSLIVAAYRVDGE